MSLIYKKKIFVANREHLLAMNYKMHNFGRYLQENQSSCKFYLLSSSIFSYCYVSCKKEEQNSGLKCPKRQWLLTWVQHVQQIKYWFHKKHWYAAPNGRAWSNFEPMEDFMPAQVICKFQKVQILCQQQPLFSAIYWLQNQVSNSAVIFVCPEQMVDQVPRE